MKKKDSSKRRAKTPEKGSGGDEGRDALDNPSMSFTANSQSQLDSSVISYHSDGAVADMKVGETQEELANRLEKSLAETNHRPG